MKEKRASAKKKQGWLAWLAALVLLAACGGILWTSVSQSLVPKKVSTEEKNRQTQIAFIKSIAYSAQQVAAANDLYPSVMIAQAVLESDSGQSRLSQAPAYNYFGIKGDYKGQAVTYWTWEDDGQGNAIEVQANFKSYGSAANSFQDYADFLDWPNYQGVHRTYAATYQDATKALTGVYATDTSYNQKLDTIIQTYGLTLYDNPLPNAVFSSGSGTS